MSPTSRSLKLLRDRGYLAEVVEKRLPRGFTTVDLYNAFDILGISTEGQIIAVQTTSHNGGNFAKRKQKVLASEVFPMWKAGGHKIEIHGWHAKQQGKRKKWVCRVEAL